jgi:hypothetical protein
MAERFAQASGAPSVPLYEYESQEFRTKAFSWQHLGGESMLEVAMVQRDTEWLTRLTLRRCRPHPVVAVLGRGSDTPLYALDARIESLPDGGKRINVEYLTKCYFSDRKCVEAEARAAWPEMREWAEALDVSIVWLTAWRGGGGSGITFERDASGNWSNNLVYP